MHSPSRLEGGFGRKTFAGLNSDDYSLGKRSTARTSPSPARAGPFFLSPTCHMASNHHLGPQT